MSPPARRIASTLDLRPNSTFERRADVLRTTSDDRTSKQVTVFLRILAAAVRGRPLILYSSWGRLKPDLLACVVMSYWPARWRPHTVMVGEMWQPSTGRLAAVERFLVRRADKAVGRYLVPSQVEADLLPQNWPVSPHKAQPCMFYFYPPQHDLVAPLPNGTGSYVFSGGDSFRDYEPLLEAARRMPDVPFRIATLHYSRATRRCRPTSPCTTSATPSTRR